MDESSTPLEPQENSKLWSKGDSIALLVLVALTLGALPFLVHSWYDQVNDASVYLLTAKAMAAGEGYSYLGSPFYLRAPGMAALAAPFAGPEGFHFFAVNLVVSLFGVACVLLYFLYNRKRLGWALALGCALVLWSLPGFQRLSNQVMSDVPGAALLLGCLLIERWSSRNRTVARESLLGVAIGISTYVRSALLLLLPAIILARLIQYWVDRRRGDGPVPFPVKPLTLFAGVAILVMLPWAARNALLDRSREPVDQTLQYSLSTLLLHEDVSDPDSPRVGAGELLARLPRRAGEAVLAMGRMRMVLGEDDVVVGDGEQKEGEESEPAAGTLSVPRIVWGGVLFAGLLVALARRREPAEIFLGGYLLVLAIFPTPFLDRYILPVFVFALPAFVEVLRGSIGRFSGSRVAHIGTFVLLITFSVLVFDPRKGWDEIESTHLESVSLSKKLNRMLKPDAKLASPRGAHLSVYLNRPVYSMRYAVQNQGVEDGSRFLVDKYDLDAVILPGRSRAKKALKQHYRKRGDAERAIAGTNPLALVFYVGR